MSNRVNKRVASKIASKRIARAKREKNIVKPESTSQQIRKLLKATLDGYNMAAVTSFFEVIEKVSVSKEGTVIINRDLLINYIKAFHPDTYTIIPEIVRKAIAVKASLAPVFEALNKHSVEQTRESKLGVDMCLEFVKNVAMEAMTLADVCFSNNQAIEEFANTLSFSDPVTYDFTKAFTDSHMNDDHVFEVLPESAYVAILDSQETPALKDAVTSCITLIKAITATNFEQTTYEQYKAEALKEFSLVTTKEPQ